MNVIITGAAGFVGGHLARRLLGRNHDITGVDIDIGAIPPEIGKQKADLTDSGQTDKLIKDFKPDQLYHLAAQSSVSHSWKQPWETFRANVLGGINLLESIRKFSPGCRTLVVCTAEEYGRSEEDRAIPEDFNIFPQNPYAISKAALDFFSLTYSRAYSLNVLVTRSFNHLGPGQSERFVCSDFARQVAMIELGLAEPVIKVGNLEAYRDFMDVRDVAAAYEAIVDRGSVGRPYNVCSGKKVKIMDILYILIGLSSEKEKIKVEVDEAKFRPIDALSVYGDNSRLMEHTGWSPEYSLETSLDHTLGWWRERVKSEERSKK